MAYLPQLSRRSFLRSAALASTTFLALVACGQATSESQQTSTSSQPLRLGFNIWAGFMPWQVAREKKFFEANNLTVEFTWFPVLSDQMVAFNAQKLDIVGAPLSDFLNSIGGGVQAKAVSVLDMSLGADAILAAPSINSLKEISGKSASVEIGTIGHFILLKALQKAGIPADQVKMVNQTPDAAVAALIAGKTEVAYAYEPYVSQAVASGKGKIIFSSKDIPGLAPDVLIVQQSVLDTQPEAVEKLLNVWYQTLDYRTQHLDEVLAIEAKQAGVSVAEYQKLLEGLKWLTPQEVNAAFQPGQTNDSLIYTAKEVTEFMLSQKLLSKEPPAFETLIDDRFLKAHL
jgi:NitT/TauT family transport system substrate-binding protein